MPTDGSCCYTPGLPTPTVAGPPVAVHNPCEMATPVFICNTPVLAPITVVGEDCAGAPLPVTGHDLIQTVPAPGAVQLVKFCNPTGNFDREFSTLCAPDGTKVLVVTAWDTTAPLATAPTIEAYDLTGAPYAGDKALLVDCAAEKLDVVTEEYCSGGVQYERTSFYDVTTMPPTLAATLWRDSTGASVSAPAAGYVGACAAVIPDRKVLIYLQQNLASLAMADIVATVGTFHVQSVTVKQILGTGSVTGDSGSGVPLTQGETWSWSAVTGADAWDHLGASALKMNAGSGGEQRITATYIL
jgi:hypothetical protein